jgi:hypothetical protein
LPQTNVRIYISTVLFLAGEKTATVEFDTIVSKNCIMQCLLTFAGSRIVGFTLCSFLFSFSFAGLVNADTRKSAHMAVDGLLASVD